MGAFIGSHFTYYPIDSDSQLFENEEYFFLVTDVCKGGDLKDELMNSGLFTEKRAAKLMQQILSCVNYFHSKGIVHRDLKPGNILLEAKKKKKNDRVRIIDFGMATHCKKGEKLSETLGTVAYMAPEVLGMSYSFECDIWSVGVILFLILSGKQPFKGKTHEETFTKIVNGDFNFSGEEWETISDAAKDFIKKLLTWDEGLRPTAAQALKHPWIVSNGACSMKELGTSAVDAMKNLEEFDAHSMLKLATCTFIASQLLPKNEKAKIEEVFRAIDTNNDGKLSKSEVKIGYGAVFGKTLSDDDVDRIFKNVNASGTGELEYTEFVFGALGQKELLSKENLSKVFHIFAKSDASKEDKREYITTKELNNLLKFDLALENEAVQKIMTDFDKAEDDRISLNDFLAMAAIPPAAVEPNTAVKTSAPEPLPLEEPEASPEEESDQSETESDSEHAEKLNASERSLSIKFSAFDFVSHRLGALTDHYEIIDFIAKGSYGVVCSARHKETDTVRAVKELKKSKKNQAKNELLLKEFHILKKLDHPNILQMYELFEDKRHYYIVTGVSQGGDLHREIKKRERFEERDAAVLMRQILICVNYCHKHNVVHRDLKPGNVLLEGHKNLNHIKVIDFGEAVESEPSAILTEIAGTMSYMAPEVLGQKYGHKCDIWSCGVITYIVLSGKQPLKGATDQETFSNIAKGEISYADPLWQSLSDEAQDFVKLLLTWDVDHRPTASEALEHPWMKKAENTSEELHEHTKNALSNLESFDARSKLRVATCTFIASQLMDKAEKEKIDDVFRAIDVNHDGTLDRQEVKQGYEKYFNRALSDDEIDAIFKHVDSDGTGELEYSEFLFGALDKQDLLSSENLKKAFRIFDKDDDGNISMEELKLLLGDALTHDDTVDEKALNKLIAQVDVDGDGEISYEEFVHMALGTSTQSFGSNEEETPTKGKRKSVSFSGENPKRSGSPPPAAKAPVDDSRHLQDAITQASKQETTSRSNRDPPIYRPGRRDPPTDSSVKSKGPPDPTTYKTEKTEVKAFQAQDPLPSQEALRQPLQYSEYRKPAADPAAQNFRKSPRVQKLEAACQGFDRVQEKIARLRTLVSSQDVASTQQRPLTDGERLRRSQRRGKGPNIESLDSAFAKLNQIQSKMRALQALAKSNQMR